MEFAGGLYSSLPCFVGLADKGEVDGGASCAIVGEDVADSPIVSGKDTRRGASAVPENFDRVEIGLRW
jgi:hypothetical protein